MASINISVNVLDEKCKSCNCMDLKKEEYYADLNNVITEFACSHLHLCRYIKNRIVHNEEAEKMAATIFNSDRDKIIYTEENKEHE
jgi:hypothetical protein